MKPTTKKEMMNYRTIGLRYLNRIIEESSIMENELLRRQVTQHLEEFNSASDRMKMSMAKSDLKIIHKELITIVRTISYLIEEQENLISVFHQEA